MEKLFINLNITQTNITNKYLLALSKTTKSIEFLDRARQINIYSTLVFVLIGLVGHSLTLYVYSQKKFRLNSGNVYLVCLALVDGLFLIVHIFEDTIRIIKDTYTKNANLNLIVQVLNIVDESDLACSLVNYMRNVLRFLSAYIIVAFTLQRLFIVYKPLLNKFKTKKSAWLTFIIILIISLTINIWAPFMFEIQKDEIHPYCDVNREWTREYFIINTCYMCLVMILPILIIFTCNFLIIFKTFKDDSRRRTLKEKKTIQHVQIYNRKRNAKVELNDLNRLKLNNKYNKKTNSNQTSSSLKQVYSKKMTKTLTMVSLSYAVLNLPYVFAWCVFFLFTTVINIDVSTRNDLFSVVKITEIFNTLNYCIHFYIYCLSGSMFRNQLKYSIKTRLTVKKTISFKAINIID